MLERSCPMTHREYVISGQIRYLMVDGTDVTASAGDAREPTDTAAGFPRSVRLFAQAVEVARPVELDQRLAPAAGPDLAPGNESMTAQRPTIGRPADQLPFIEDRSGPGHHAGAPLRVPGGILPAVHRRRRQARAREGHVEKGEALVPFGHGPTIAGRTGITLAGVTRA